MNTIQCKHGVRAPHECRECVYGGDALLQATADGEFESLPRLADKLERAALSFEVMASQSRNGAYVSIDEWHDNRDALRAIASRVRAALAKVAA